MKFFESRSKRKKKKEMLERKISQKEYEPFLKEVEKAIGGLLKETSDDKTLTARMGVESTRWLNDLPEMKLADFKAGVCFGIYTLCKQKTEPQEKKKVPYVV